MSFLGLGSVAQRHFTMCDVHRATPPLLSPASGQAKQAFLDLARAQMSFRREVPANPSCTIHPEIITNYFLTEKPTPLSKLKCYGFSEPLFLAPSRAFISGRNNIFIANNGVTDAIL